MHRSGPTCTHFTHTYSAAFTVRTTRARNGQRLIFHSLFQKTKADPPRSNEPEPRLVEASPLDPLPDCVVVMHERGIRRAHGLPLEIAVAVWECCRVEHATTPGYALLASRSATLRCYAFIESILVVLRANVDEARARTGVRVWYGRSRVLAMQQQSRAP